MIRAAAILLGLAAILYPTAAQTPTAYAVLYWAVDDAQISDLYRWEPETGSVLIAEDVGQASGGVVAGDWLYFPRTETIGDVVDVDVYRIRIDGGAPEFVMDTDCLDIPISASPDGTQLIVLAVHNDCFNMYSVDTATGESRLIAGDIEDYDGLSPDGEWILVSVARDENDIALMRVRTDGTESLKILDTPVDEFITANYRWTNDGAVMFTGYSEVDGSAVYRIQADGTGLEPLTSLDRDYSVSGGSTFSPDGLWNAALWVGGHAHLQIISTADDMQVIMPEVSGPRVSANAWRPDSGALAYNGPEGGLFIFDVETGETIHIDAGEDMMTWFATWLDIGAPEK